MIPSRVVTSSEDINNAPTLRMQNLRRLLSDGREAEVAIPLTLEPGETEPAAARAAEEIKDVLVTVLTQPDRVECNDRELPLQLGILLAQGEDLSQVCRSQTLLTKLPHDLVRLHRSLELNYVDGNLGRTVLLLSEVLGGDVAMCPVILPGLDHFLDRAVCFDANKEDMFSAFESSLN